MICVELRPPGAEHLKDPFTEATVIYRVTIRTTGSVQPGRGATFWQSEVIHCGTDLEEARVAYLRSRPEDYGGSYGNKARETVIEQFESEPEEIDSEACAEVEVEE